MEVLPPPLQVSLSFVAFVANLIDLNQFNTILVLHDQKHQDQINFLIENLQPRYDVAWILVNEYKKPEYWNHAILQVKNILILTAVHQDNIVPLLMPLYNEEYLDARSKNLIVSSDISIKTLPQTNYLKRINAVFVDCTLDELKIYAWNPKKSEKSIELNETEFISASSGYLTNRKYSGVFFEQLQSMNGEQIHVVTTYDTKKTYRVISKGLAASIDDTIIRTTDMIGEAMQSPLKFSVLQLSDTRVTISKRLLSTFLEQTYSTFETLPPRNIEIITAENMITAGHFIYRKLFGNEAGPRLIMHSPYTERKDYLIISKSFS